MEIIKQIALTNSSFIPPIVKDYLNKADHLRGFVSHWHQSAGLEDALSKRGFSAEKRAVLVSHLRDQYQAAKIDLTEAEKVEHNIHSLLGGQSFTICTGHQLSLFGGTLFMTYKILSAIKLALNLSKQFPEHRFVPVLWLASEDHDFEEIQTTYLFGKEITWETASQSMPTGKIALENIAEIVEELGVLMGNNEEAKRWFSQLHAAYVSEGNLGEATIRLYHELFKAFGLVILDPNAKVLKSYLHDIVRADILGQESFAVQQVSDAVLSEQYKLQINARPINFFYLSAVHGRKMIRKNEDGSYSLADSAVHWLPQEMESEIAEFPERFSPNVNLRPIYQELILPNLAYVGGPAEVAYWLQLKPLFDHYQVPYPLVALRYMNVIVPKNLLDKLLKMGLQIEDVLLSEPNLKQKYLEQVQGISFPEKFDAILHSLQELVDHAKHLDVGLGKEMLDFKLQVKDFFKGKTGSIKRAAEQHEEAQIEKLLKLRARLFPKGVLQERIETLMQHEVQINRALLPDLLEQIEVLSGKLDITLS